MNPERVNEPQGIFNEPGRLFQNDTPPGAPKIVRRFVVPSDPSLSAVPPTSGRVQRQLGATPEDFPGEEVVQQNSPEVPRDVVTGSFSLARAARVVHQYDVDYWSAEGVVGSVAASPLPPPSASEIESKYNDFLAYSYLPSSMVPTLSVFGDMLNPRAKISFVTSALPAAGVNTKAGTSDGLINQPATGFAVVITVLPVPFAENLQSACGGSNFFQRSSGPLYRGDRGLA
jgi:hypothetical protein